MKEKIKRFSKGDFQINKPNIIFPESNLTLKIGEGEIYNGSFLIENQLDGDIRGLVYPSSFRMQCKEQGFEGSPVLIHFQYDGRGLKPGHVERGIFTIVCNGGEFEIGFSAIIEKPYIMSSQGKIQDLRGFKKLAYQYPDEAKKIFKSRDFYEIIKYEQPKIKNLYDHMRKWNLNELGLEEFLVGIKQKEKIFLSLDSKERLYKNIDSIQNDVLEISKNTWGYLEIKVTTDSDFIETAVEWLSTNDFVGMKYNLIYTIKHSQLHAGRNFGHIIIETAFEKLVYLIEVDNSIGDFEDKRKADYLAAHILKSVLRLESGVINKENWIHKVLKLISELQLLEPANEEYKLYQAHAYVLVGEYEEAHWILETYSYSKFSVGRNVELDAYYLFLSALQRRELSYTKKIVEELQRAYLKNPKSWKILCMLTQVDSYYNDYFERKHALENQYNLGANHLMFYLESYKCFSVKSTNLKKLGGFEIQILRFSIKYKLLSNELALYMANLATQQKFFDKRILVLLENAYDLYPDPMILTAICTMLIKGNESSSRYFKWYKKAVEEDIKIAKLFEYFMESIPVNYEDELPRTILLYFAHGNNLNQDKAALLYANIILYEKENSVLYKCYYDSIKIFILQQLELRRINHNLRILYRSFISENEMNIEKIKAIYDICHTYLVTTKVPNIRYALVIANDGGIYQKVPYTEQGAYIVLDSKEELLVWEAIDGTHYVGSVKYKTERAFHETKYIEMCKQRMNISDIDEVISENIPLTMNTLRQYGLNHFDASKVLLMCSKEIRTENLEEEDFLTYVLFELFKKEEYDKVTLEYLTNFYCGSTRNMKEIWFAAKDYEVDTSKLAERIISQMLFSEVIVGEDEIFVDYYLNGAYFRLEEAYIAYVSREHVSKNKVLSPEIVEIIMNELHRKSELPDIVKIAMLKYFSVNQYDAENENILKHCMQELCEKQIYFDFYMKYAEDWLREVQLWDKTLITYTSKMGGKVKLIYQLQTKGSDSVEYESEVLIPTFESIYVKKFLVFKDEVLRYYFKETLDDNEIKGEKKIYHIDSTHELMGKFGRLNDIISNPEKRTELMREYALEEALAGKMFSPYE
ncbi:MAG: DUF5717 family protein [Eubacteriales bacterium]